MRARYVPDLNRQIALCEANYRRLLQLLPDLDHCDLREFQVAHGELPITISLQVEERFNYTTTLRVSQWQEQESWLGKSELVVRLYHDAKLAEVIGERRRQLSGRYQYPNKQMHQPDEKLQLNAFLAEWLSHCLEHGHLLEEVVIS